MSGLAQLQVLDTKEQIANCVYKLSTCDVTFGNPWDLGLGSAPAERVDQGEVIGFSTGLK